MKKGIAIVTTIVIAIMATLQGTEFGQEVSGLFSDVWAYIGVAAGGYGSLVVYGVYSYIKTKLGVDVITELKNFLTNNPSETEEVLSKVLGTETAKQMIVNKNDFIELKEQQLRDKIIDYRQKLFDLNVKINTEGLLTSQQLKDAAILKASYEEWLNENDTKTV